MHLHLLLFAFYYVKCLNVEISGDVTFEVKISDINVQGEENYKNRAIEGDEIENGLVFKLINSENVTMPPFVECVYQYPESEQINEMLSNMMNELTKVFIQVQELMGNGSSNRRKQDRRFRVVNKTNTDFFENIYKNMTNEYRQFYNDTALRINRSRQEPCQHQEEIKQMWKDILEKSLQGLRRASQKCIEEYIRLENRSKDNRIVNKINHFLIRELGKIRSKQLDILCDKFQLCYNDLL